MGQAIEASFVCDGRYRIHSIRRLGQQPGRIIEIEGGDTGKRLHGPLQRLQRTLLSLIRRSTHEDRRGRD